jgi:hypothetical protein
VLPELGVGENCEEFLQQNRGEFVHPCFRIASRVRRLSENTGKKLDPCQHRRQFLLRCPLHQLSQRLHPGLSSVHFYHLAG